MSKLKKVPPKKAKLSHVAPSQKRAVPMETVEDLADRPQSKLVL
jgi:hypothetical protein